MEINEGKYGPVRKVIHRGTVRLTGWFVSRKMKRCIPWESSIEKDFVHLLEFDREVAEYFAQPFWVEFTFGGEHCKACPDFLAIYTDGEERVWEVKPATKAKKEEIKKRHAAIARVLQRKGRSFECVTEETIRAGKRLKNIKELFAYLSVDPDKREALDLREVFDTHDLVTLGGLLDGEYGTKFTKPTIYAMLAQRVLDVDIEGPLNKDAEVENYSLQQFLQRGCV